MGEAERQGGSPPQDTGDQGKRPEAPPDDSQADVLAEIYRLFSPSGRELRLWREETQAYIIDRAAFNVAMGSQAQDVGAEYVLNSLVSNIEVGDDKVRVEANHQGERLNFEARVVIIATGFGSGLAQKLGLGKVGDFAIGAQAEVETTGVDEIEVYFSQEIAPGSLPGWCQPHLKQFG